MTIEPDEFLSALDDARAEREALHPHRPVLGPDRHLTVVRTDTSSHADAEPAHRAEFDRYLDEATVELGHRRIAEIRAQLERNRQLRSDPA